MNGLESVLERCREALEPHRERSGTGLGAIWERSLNGLESILERCRRAIEPHRVFAASLRAVLDRSWSGLGAMLDRSGNGLGPREKICKKCEK